MADLQCRWNSLKMSKKYDFIFYTAKHEMPALFVLSKFAES